MNEIVNKFLLTGNKFMPEIYLKSGFTYSACGPFTKSKERVQKFKETGDTKYIYRNELDKDCFQHDLAYEYFKDLAKRTASDKVLRDEGFNIAKNTKYDAYQGGLASMVYEFFDKKSATGRGVTTLANNQPYLELATQQLAEKLHTPIIKELKKRVYSLFKDNMWGADLADMQLISKFNKGTRFLLCVIDIFSKYAWVVPLKDKKGITIVNAFQKILNNSTRKPNKI